MREQVKDFQEKMNQQAQFQGTAGESAQTHTQKKENKAKAGDYIDFEEIKER